jgi:dolichol-phosphate mannosyltransferase
MAADSRFQAGRLQALVQWAWPATVVTTVLIYAAGLHYLVLGLPGLAYPQNFMLLGWLDLGRQIEQIEDELEAASGSDPLVVGMNKYQIASGLAFYRTRALQGLSGPAGEKEGVLDTTGRHLFGKDSLMYRYWLSAKSAQDRDMILVSDKPDGLTDARVRSRFRKLGDIRQIVIQKNNRPVGRFYWLFAEGYRSD